MKEVWMLDYLNAVFPYMGVFESEQDAWDWVNLATPGEESRYRVFKLTVNSDLKPEAPHTAPFTRYVNQR